MKAYFCLDRGVFLFRLRPLRFGESPHTSLGVSLKVGRFVPNNYVYTPPHPYRSNLGVPLKMEDTFSVWDEYVDDMCRINEMFHAMIDFW